MPHLSNYSVDGARQLWLRGAVVFMSCSFIISAPPPRWHDGTEGQRMCETLTERERQRLVPGLDRHPINVKAMGNCHTALQGANKEWAPQTLTTATTHVPTDFPAGPSRGQARGADQEGSSWPASLPRSCTAAGSLQTTRLGRAWGKSDHSGDPSPARERLQRMERCWEKREPNSPFRA